jgi:hypothetical protein
MGGYGVCWQLATAAALLIEGIFRTSDVTALLCAARAWRQRQLLTVGW